MPGSFMGSKPGSHLPRTRTRPGGPSRLARLLTFRQVMYARMEEVSFRTSMTVLAGVVAFAAVVASVSTLMSLSSGPAQHAAPGRPPAYAAPSPASPSRPAPAPPSASSSRPPASPSPVRSTGPDSGAYTPVTAAAASEPSPGMPARWLSHRAAAAAWWSWWLRVYGGGSDRAYGGGGSRGFGQGRGGFGSGGGFGGFGRR
ncbi:MAG: hypothetical protein ABSF03_27535 [Streptosporangiaceae bacterium]